MKVILETLAASMLFFILAVLLNVASMKTASAKTPGPQIGEASWYGGFHHGRKMANGKAFNMHSNTVAHRTLPLGTRVQVKNIENGKSVIATVTDRGPYAKRRVLDVSRGIASKLDMLKVGTAKVQITVLSLPDSKDSKRYKPDSEELALDTSKDVDSIENFINEFDQPYYTKPLIARDMK